MNNGDLVRRRYTKHWGHVVKVTDRSVHVQFAYKKKVDILGWEEVETAIDVQFDEAMRFIFNMRSVGDPMGCYQLDSKEMGARIKEAFDATTGKIRQEMKILVLRRGKSFGAETSYTKSVWRKRS